MDANHWHRYFIDILKHLDTSLHALRPIGALDTEDGHVTAS